MLSTTEAWQTIVSHARQLETVTLPLEKCLGLVLRVNAYADSDSPPFDASAMDGYAMRRSSIGQTIRIIGEVPAGRPFTGRVNAGECVRIFTGAPVPPDCDCVVKQEDVAREGDAVLVQSSDQPDFIRRRGENRRAGNLIVPAGTHLSAANLAALASAGITQPEVTRVPRCVHLVTGNEIVPPDQKPTGAQIRDSNSTLIAALLKTQGAELLTHAHARDDLASAQHAVTTLPDHDVLLISGGASVGDHDFARPLLQSLGFTSHFQALNLRPGKPLVFASKGNQLAFALPGNPVSHWVVFHLFVAPLLQHLQTGAAAGPARLKGRIAVGTTLPVADKRQTFWPSRATIVAGMYELTPLPLASSGDSSGLVGANALLPLPTDGASFDSNQPVEFIPCP
jgi:molybdopterin molybdotransferase